MAADEDVGEDQRRERRQQQQPAQDREGLEAGALEVALAADPRVLGRVRRQPLRILGRASTRAGTGSR